jgi:acyl-CoA thioester hydrolase
VEYTTTFTVRQYECDAYGHLNNVTYVRWMQEVAIEASAYVGWTLDRLNALNSAWVIRETDIEYLLPLYYGETVTVRTWVEDFRKVRSLRRYEFLRADGTKVAHATTDWVYIDKTTQQPLAIPTDMMHDYRPDDAVPTLARDKFPVAPPPPAKPFVLSKRVEWRDIDTLGHANNASYFTMIEDAGFQASRAFGWGVANLIQNKVAVVARSLRVNYLQAAQVDDDVTITTYLSNLKRIMAHRHFIIRRVHDNALLAQARALFVFINYDTLQPIRPPQHMLNDFQGHIVDA